MNGPERLIKELLALGHEAELVTATDGNRFAVISNFVVPLGRFAGREIDLGFLGTADFPISVASSIHVRANPQLYEKTDSVANVRNITDSALGPEWRYWSKNLGWNGNGEKSARHLMTIINGVFENA